MRYRSSPSRPARSSGAAVRMRTASSPSSRSTAERRFAYAGAFSGGDVCVSVMLEFDRPSLKTTGRHRTPAQDPLDARVQRQRGNVVAGRNALLQRLREEQRRLHNGSGRWDVRSGKQDTLGRLSTATEPEHLVGTHQLDAPVLRDIAGET